MKPLMTFGGLLGFGIGVSLGLIQQSDWPTILWRSAVAAYAAGWLMRWWGQIWMQGLKEVGEERLAAARARAAEIDRKHKV
ncbi:MAG TPA: hypothetical protein DCY13_12260 [Verrucomicrobiales bacterium]|nr:hypothetical protein [Verrucomicrobiales bacterium]